MRKIFKKITSLTLSMMIAGMSVPSFATDSFEALEESDSISLQSLLPLEEVYVDLDLRDELPASVKNMSVADLLTRLTDRNTGESVEIDPDVTSVWERVLDEDGNWSYDTWKVTGMSDTLNMLPYYYYGDADDEDDYDDYTSMELIVGSGNQLDPDNVRYLVRVYPPDARRSYKVDLYEQLVNEGTNGAEEEIVRNRIPCAIKKSRIFRLEDDGTYTYIPYLYLSVPPKYSAEDDYYLNLSLNEDRYPGYTISVYSGMYNSADEAVSAAEKDSKIDITAQITNQDMTAVDAGYRNKWADSNEMKELTVVFSDGTESYTDSFVLGVNPRENDVDPCGIYIKDENGNMNSSYYSSSWNYKYIGSDYSQYIRVITYKMEPEYPANDEYYFGMYGYNGETEENYNSDFVIKAVVGHYDSLEAAEDQPDIKDMLFADSYDSGTEYKANFSGDGIDFTVFSEDEYWQFTIIAVDYQDEMTVLDDGAPNVGSSDRYFRVTSLYTPDNQCLDTYTVPYAHDTYYSNGYQTLLINDTEADITALQPYVSLGYNAKVYHDGIMEKTDDSETSYGSTLSAQDFSAVPQDRTTEPANSVKYTVSAENHIDQKNYFITVVKKTEGAKLFVNGPDEREIFLNNYYDNIHDIFIANIGTEELTGIKVTLDATNVKLDHYWTIGGEGNDTLAPFTETHPSNGNWYGELYNVAKIRLIPDGEGDINGTLTITADGQEPRVITLKGQAGNPKIDTDSLHDAVKYVPYQSIVTTNNMHDWNKVTFSLDSGKLPNGVELLPSGEIYGVPKETGAFTFKVKADYSYSQFTASIATLTLQVLQNTDENVNAQTDEGYEIITRVPATIRTDADEIFEFEYDYAEHEEEFQGFWLDGERLEKDVDYTVDAGSTKITIKSQTISSAGNGTHTIAAEYRTSSTNEVKKAAQNYTKSSSSRGGSSGSGGLSSCKVWFEVNGGAWLQEATVKYGSTVSALPTPVRDGYEFAGWYTDSALTKSFDPTTKITKNTTLYAKWNEIYKVWFEVNGGAWLDSVDVTSGKTVSSLPTPERDGYIFDGWYTDEEFSQLYDVSKPVTQTVVLYAKWTEDKPPVDAIGFIDVNTSDWFYSDVDWVYNNKLMIGVSNQYFEPNSVVTGGMVVTVLARMANEDVSQYETLTFDDVYEGEWYTPYAKWAKSIGLVDNIPFNPPKEISREWMGIILNRYLEYIGAEYSIDDETVRFADEDLISDEAKNDLQTLFKLGIFHGRGDNIIDPESFTTRAEFAALINRVNAFINQ